MSVPPVHRLGGALKGDPGTFSNGLSVHCRKRHNLGFRQIRKPGASINRHFHIDVRESPDNVCIAVEGELDLETVPQLRAAVVRARSAAPPLVVIDLAGVSFIDSTGLTSLLESHLRAQSEGDSLQVTGWSGQPQRVLELAGVIGRPPFRAGD